MSEIIERRGSCDQCGLCEVGGSGATLVWTRPYDGKPLACYRTDYDDPDFIDRDWPESLDRSLEGCSITFWRVEEDGSSRRILGKRTDASGHWAYPDVDVTEG